MKKNEIKFALSKISTIFTISNNNKQKTMEKTTTVPRETKIELGNYHVNKEEAYCICNGEVDKEAIKYSVAINKLLQKAYKDGYKFIIKENK